MEQPTRRYSPTYGTSEFDGHANASELTSALGDRSIRSRARRSSPIIARQLSVGARLCPGLAFNTAVGTALEHRNVSHSWSKLCASRSASVRLHDLRHSAATFMLSAGVDLKMIQKTLRHSRLATTADVYAHVLDGEQHQAAARTDSVLA